MSESPSISMLGRAALRYAELGYAVFPLVPGHKTPLTTNGHLDATIDSEQIEKWWTDHPLANVGIAATGIVVIDLDGKANPWLADQPDRQAQLSAGPLAITWSGGLHHYFARPPGATFRCSQGELAAHVDVRTDGGYVVAPPSAVNGTEYRFAPGQDLDVPIGRLPPLPVWLGQLLETGTKDRPKVPLKEIGGNRIPDGVRNGTLTRLGGAMRQYGFAEPEISAALRVVAEQRCDPPLPVEEADKVARSVAQYPPDQICVATAEDHFSQDRASISLGPVGLSDFLRNHTALRQPIIHGLLRRGETANIIAPPKSRKSWLVNDLVACAATGRPWLGAFTTTKSRVLVIDNELHPETIADRFPKVAEARGIALADIGTNVKIWSLRGMLKDLVDFEPDLRALGAGAFDLIIMDAFYRMLPAGIDENDNGAMVQLYNLLDRTADRLGCAFVVVHHASKGNQSNKSVTDVGAGAGSQSRAADTHIALRQHKEDDALVFDGVVRSWQPIEPFVIRWSFPTWSPAPDLDPTQLRKQKPGKASEPQVDLVEFVERFITADPTPRVKVIEKAVSAGVSARQAKELLSAAAQSSSVQVTEQRGNKPSLFSRRKDGEIEESPSEEEP